MAKMLLKDNEIIADDWLIFNDSADVQAELSAKIANIIPLDIAKKYHDIFMAKKRKAILIRPDDIATDLKPFIKSLDLIVISFPQFTDGRGYSHAHIIRNSLQWRGELRAVGNILPDQYPYMLQCGFTSFKIDGARHTAALYKQAQTNVSLKYQLRSNNANGQYKTIMAARHPAHPL
jgi:uncharacterized protein (DUF934 family)